MATVKKVDRSETLAELSRELNHNLNDRRHGFLLRRSGRKSNDSKVYEKVGDGNGKVIMKVVDSSKVHGR